MTYTLYKLRYKTPVLFGRGRLGKTAFTFYADTLFSAMCIEAEKMKPDGSKWLYDAAVSGGLCLSDGMLYVADSLFIPKPMTEIKAAESGDPGLKKQFKKLSYIPLTDLDAYLSGNYDPTHANELLEGLGKYSEQVRVSVGRDKDSKPYSVGTFTFADDCGLYFICAADEEIVKDIDEIIKNISYTGLGGKISSGLGKFDYTPEKVPQIIKERLEGDYEQYMSLSVCMGSEYDDMDTVLDGAGYELIKRSGFVASSAYSDEPVKKRDFYAFKAGACFTERFKGDVFDVGGGGAHPVYRYAKPMLMGMR